MKYIIFAFILTSFTFLKAQEVPTEIKTEFDEISLAQTLQDLEGNSFTVGEILEKHAGKIILLDIWASWCPDCITGLPKLKEVQNQFPELVYLFFSLDRMGKEDAWKNAIQKYEIQGEHYWFNTAWKNPFTEFIGLNWIPRYMLIDAEGKIAHYYAIHADDSQMMDVLVELFQVPEN